MQPLLPCMPIQLGGGNHEQCSRIKATGSTFPQKGVYGGVVGILAYRSFMLTLILHYANIFYIGLPGKILRNNLSGLAESLWEDN